MFRSRPERWFDRFRRTGDAKWLARVFDAVAPELWRVAAILCRDQHLAEDAVQATFLSALEAPHDWDASRPLVPWLLGMLGNRVREHRRRAARAPDPARFEPNLERDAARNLVRDPAEVAADREAVATLRQALARLDEPYRATLERHLVHGLAAHEIARELGLSAGAVRMRLHRGFDQLRATLPTGLFAAGGVALALPTTALAAMRQRVLGEAPGGAGAAAGSAHVASSGSFLGGVVMIDKVLLAGVGAVFVALATWSAWSAPAATGMAVPPPPPAAVAAESTIDAASPPLVVATAPVGAEDGRSRVAAPAAAPARGLLRVRMRRAGDGAPMDAVKLRVRGGLTDDPGRRSAGEAVSEALSRSLDARDQFGKTDAAGAAEFEVPAGFVAVVAGWPEISASAEVRSGEVAELVIEAPVRFTAAVRVVDVAGAPVPDARLIGSTSRDDGGLAAREFGRTDRDGRCRIDVVDAEIRVRARHEGHAASPAIELRSNRTKATLVVGAAPAAVRGTVFDAEARPLARCAVGLQPSPRSRGDAGPILAWTDANGQFDCADVPAGRCIVVAVRRLADGSSRLAQQETIAVAGAPTAVEVRFGQGAALDVLFTAADGSSLLGNHLQLSLQQPDFDDEFAQLGTTFIRLDERGAGTVRDLLPGRYLLKHRTFERRLELAAGAHERIVHVLGAGPGCAVRVVDLAGKPLRHWIVDWTGGGWRRRAYTNADGRAHFVELPVAQGRITVSRDQDTPPLAQRDVASDAAVTVAVDPSAGGRAELRGIVAPPAGMELAALQALLVRRGDEPAGSDVRTLAIDPATGAFAATQLAAGSYMLTVGSRATGPTPLLLREAIAVPVEGTVDLGRLVIGAGRLAVQAKLADGSPVADAVMLVRMFAGAPFVLLPDSLPDHQPSSLRLPVGEYAVLVWGEAIAPVVASGRVQIDASTTVSVVTERAATVVLRLPADGAEVDGGRLTVRSNGGAPVDVVVQLAAPLARGFAAGRHELEFDGAGGKRFAAAFTVGPGLERQLVTLQPRQ